MSLLVTGGTGYIGSHTCKALAAEGYIPVTVDNLSAGHKHAVKWGPLEVADIRDGAALARIFSKYPIEAVIHFAANIEVGEGEVEPAKFYDNNVGGSLSLVNAMLKADVNKIVFSSTCATYGETQNMPLSEDEPQDPKSVYGKTKHIVEGILSSYAKAYGLKYAALRYFNAAGASPDGEIGEEHDPETHLIPNALKAAAGLGKGLKIFGNDYDTPDGTCLRDYIHVLDLAQGHIKALKALSSGHDEIQCNLGTGNGVSVLDVINAIEKVTGRKVPYEMAGRRPGDVTRLYSDVTRAQSLLGLDPQYSDIETIVSSAWTFHNARLNRQPFAVPREGV